MASALAALAFAGCGGPNPEQVLDKAFTQSIGSAQLDLGLDATLQGIPAATDAIRVSLKGPYQSGDDDTLPSFDLDASLDAGALPAPSDALGLISTGNNLFIDVAGQSYEAGEDAVADEIAGRDSDTQTNPFGVEPRTWVEDPKIVGEETIDGVATYHLTGAVSVATMVKNLNSAAAKAAEAGAQEAAPVLTDEQITQIEGILTNPTFDLYAGKSDGKIRRLSASVTFTVPEAERQGMGGLSGGKIAFQLNFTGVGKPVTITAPENAQPMKDLASQIQTLAGAAMTGQGGGAAPAGGGGDAGSAGAEGGGGGAGAAGADQPLPALPPDGGASPPGDDAFKKYTDCLAQADPNDSAALAECAKLVSGG